MWVGLMQPTKIRIEQKFDPALNRRMPLPVGLQAKASTFPGSTATSGLNTHIYPLLVLFLWKTLTIFVKAKWLSLVHGLASLVSECKPKKTVLELYSYSLVTVKENGERKSFHWAKLWEICICLQFKKKKVTSAKWLSTADQGFRRRNTERLGSRKSRVGTWDVGWHMEMDSKSKGFVLHIIRKENLW